MISPSLQLLSYFMIALALVGSGNSGTRLELATRPQRSRITFASGCEQHTSIFPGAGLSSGSGL
jgi:hypothetical protein